MLLRGNMMATKRVKTQIPGIRYREHASRKVDIQKDRYYYIFYQLNGKQKEEGVGWLSHGWTEKKVAEQLFEIKNNIKLGKHPQTLKEKREMEEEAQKEIKINCELSLDEAIKLKEALDKHIISKRCTISSIIKLTIEE